jgi:type IV pilus assembly protein PilO
MATRFLKNKSIYIPLAALIIIGGLYLSYLLFLKPLQIEIDRLENEVTTEKKVLELLQASTNQTQDQTKISTVELQKKVPTKPIIEQFILDLEKAEVVSDSFITGIGIGEEQVTEQSTIEEYVQINQENSNEDETTSDEQTDQAKLPEGLNKVTVNLSVTSSDYFAVEEFISTLENQTRLTQVENISFSGQQEITSLNQEINPISYSITVSTFFFPGLTDLVDQLPLLEVPAPSNKKNPFPTGIKDSQ